VAGREEIGEILRGAWVRYQAWSAAKVSSMPSKLIRPCSSMVRIVEAGYPTNPSEHQPVGKHLSNNIRIILQMDDGPEQSGQDDYEPDVAARAAPAAKQKAAKEYFLACSQAPCAQCRGE